MRLGIRVWTVHNPPEPQDEDPIEKEVLHIAEGRLDCIGLQPEDGSGGGNE
jgi:hypothetical protein